MTPPSVTPSPASSPFAAGIGVGRWSRWAAAFLSLIILAPAPVPAAAQAVRGPVDDPDALLQAVRLAQSRFERTRRLNLPYSLAESGGSCDEIVGRMCLWHAGDEDDWRPPPEKPEVVRAREALLDTLADAAARIPGDDWILGQRVRYLLEADRVEDALALARRCAGPSPWWCRALEGLVLHQQERFVAAQQAFDRALSEMPRDEAERWSDLSMVLDGRGATLLGEAFGDARVDLENRVWSLGDPLFLVEGNDRRTEHYARWTVARLRDDSETAYRLSWGSDFRELLVRYGAEVGWERIIAPAGGAGSNRVVGHHPRGARSFLPPGSVVEDPWTADVSDWPLEPEQPRSNYAPPYAPHMETLDLQLARFYRLPRVLLVAPYSLEGVDAGDHPEPDGSSDADGPVQAGLYLMGADDVLLGHRTEGPSRGALFLDAPPGSYVVSVELLHPGRRRAARLRRGIVLEAPTLGVAALSDIVILESGTPLPGRLSQALEQLTPDDEVHAGDTLRLGWEAYGLRPQGEAVTFEVAVSGENEGFFSRVSGWLGFGSDAPPLRVEWTESGPDVVGPFFRALDLVLDGVEPGTHTVTVRMALAGRSDVVARRTIRVRE